MGSVAARKPHAVCLPLPAQGHLNAMMQLAKLLHSRGFHVTYVNTVFNHRRLVRSRGPDSVKGLDDFRFETIPDGLPPSDYDATQDPPALCDSTRKNCLAPFRELLAKLNSSSDVPPVTCIISDGLMSFAIKAAEELGIPEVQFWPASVCGFMGCLYYSELIKRGIVPFKDENFINDGTLDTPIDWIPSMPNIRLKDIPSFIRTTDPNDILLNFHDVEAQNCLKAPAIIFNTFDALDHELLEAIKSKFPRNIYIAGSLSLLGRHMPDSQIKSIGSSLWKEDWKCLEWLDKREPNSVVYVNYGSITVMTDQHLKEFAWGLANSKHPFLWIVRPDLVMGDSAFLPDEFSEETKDRGLIASWCPQDQVLSHPSIGVFLTHCGWNSMLESICGGVPMICWPFFADQQTNCRYACTVWEIGMEVNQDVKRDEIEKLVREMMEGDKGKRMRNKTLEWKKKAEETTDIGGSSYNNFDKFINEALHCNENFINEGILDTPINWIPGMPNIRLKDIPSFIRTTDPNDIMLNFLGGEAQNCLKAPAIIFNTFDTLEHEVLEAIKAKFPRIYTAGSLSLLGRHMPDSQIKSLGSSLWKEDSKCLEWLDKREPNSVVYVNYGSITVMTDQHLKEFAWGLANNKHPFLWIVRPDVVMGDSAFFPEEFFEEIKDRGLLASWCPQDQVLSHPSIGVFLTHCGWNSMLESICGGVPVICWPFFAEQKTNCRYACTVWGIGMEVNQDVKRDEIINLVREMMEGDKGKQMRNKAQEWRKKAEAATDIGGSSYNNFDRFIEEALPYSN